MNEKPSNLDIAELAKKRRLEELNKLVEKFEDILVKNDVKVSEWKSIWQTIEARQNQYIANQVFKRYEK